MRLIEIVELTPNVRSARRLYDAACFIEFVESCVTIGLQDARKVLQVSRRMLPFSIRRIGEPYCRRGVAPRRAVIANVGPQPARLRLAVTRFQDRYRHIVAVQFLRA